EVLGVDPYWFFKDLDPEPRQRFSLVQGTIESQEPTFRYRGWFVNDEDLLTEWKAGGGERHIDYPFYHQVVHPDVLDRVLEALLRSGGNLVIPASFVDVMNPPEARLVQQAVRRGLYVTQHHIEPLGVSHFGFENYWKDRGQSCAFAYGAQPDRVREVWRAFAERWHELAGDHVVWQLGLRGKGDRSIWHSDTSVSRKDAGEMISRAIAEQWDIVRAVDPRPQPPATVTLWAEGSQLMSEGSLTFPNGITLVFCDNGPTQKMQADFYSTPRTENFRYGAYYHIGFWSTGPHLLQGTTPQRIRDQFDQIVRQGDTEYAIINVCNVREHVLGVQAATEIMCDHRGWSEAEFWSRFAPAVLHAPYQSLLANLFPLSDDRIIQDGALFAAAKKMLANFAADGKSGGVLSAAAIAQRKQQLSDAIARLDVLIADYPSAELTANDRAFYDIHFLTQAKMMREMYAFYLSLLQADEDSGQLAEAQNALERLLTVREAAETGKWTGWYRGDKKVNVPAFLEATREARRKARAG
ncbi:MAG: glycosyl hydrolase 115 family protein, partial [Planctomycetes bacterium]|nr:glycosyl hydrolase 115 family protein [Planctomycetota bacterium]